MKGVEKKYKTEILNKIFYTCKKTRETNCDQLLKLCYCFIFLTLWNVFAQLELGFYHSLQDIFFCKK